MRSAVNLESNDARSPHADADHGAVQWGWSIWSTEGKVVTKDVFVWARSVAPSATPASARERRVPAIMSVFPHYNVSARGGARSGPWQTGSRCARGSGTKTPPLACSSPFISPPAQATGARAYGVERRGDLDRLACGGVEEKAGMI